MHIHTNYIGKWPLKHTPVFENSKNPNWLDTWRHHRTPCSLGFLPLCWSFCPSAPWPSRLCFTSLKLIPKLTTQRDSEAGNPLTCSLFSPLCSAHFLSRGQLKVWFARISAAHAEFLPGGGVEGWWRAIVAGTLRRPRPRRLISLRSFAETAGFTHPTPAGALRRHVIRRGGVKKSPARQN